MTIAADPDLAFLRALLRTASHMHLGADSRPTPKDVRIARRENVARIRTIIARVERGVGSEADLRLLADRAHALAMRVLQSSVGPEFKEEILGVLDLVDAYGAPKERARG